MRLLKSNLKKLYLSLGVIGLSFIYQACSDQEGLAGTTTTAENGIQGVAKQTDGSFFPENSDVLLKSFSAEDSVPGFKVIEQAKVQELGRFYIPIKDTGQFVLEVESNQESSQLQRKLINIDDLDSLYQLDTLKAVQTIERSFKVVFETAFDFIKKDSIWLGQLGMESLIPISNMDTVTIPYYDPELSDLILVYVDVQGVLRNKTLRGIRPDQILLDISKYFIEDSVTFENTDGELYFEDQ